MINRAEIDGIFNTAQVALSDLLDALRASPLHHENWKRIHQINMELSSVRDCVGDELDA